MAHLALGGGDRDVGATVAAQMYEVADRLPARQSFRRRWCGMGWLMAREPMESVQAHCRRPARANAHTAGADDPCGSLSRVG
jgi:hypothetical protein